MINPKQIREDQPTHLQLQVHATTSPNNNDACKKLAVASHDEIKMKKILKYWIISLSEL